MIHDMASGETSLSQKPKTTTSIKSMWNTTPSAHKRVLLAKPKMNVEGGPS